MATINRENLLSKNRLEMAFRMFDKVLFFFNYFLLIFNKIRMEGININYIFSNIKTKSGTLELQEIKEIFCGCGTVSDHVWDDIIKEVDANGDG